MLQRAHWQTDQQHMLVVVADGRLGAAEVNSEAGKGSSCRLGRRAHRFLIDHILDTNAATSERRRPPEANAVKSRPVTHVHKPFGGACFQERCLPALALARPVTRLDRDLSAPFSEGAPKAPLRPRHRVRIDQVVSRRRTVPGACGPSARSRRSARNRPRPPPACRGSGPPCA